jgi:uncharacterized coiled-coil DUF342 family protein
MKINFTAEHQARLQTLALGMLFGGTKVKGLMGTDINVYQLINEVTIQTLTTLYGNLKKELEKIQSLDEWSMTDYQQRRAEELKTIAELVNLTIGYKRHQSQLYQEKAEINELKAQLKQLKESTLSPGDKIAALEKQIASMGGNVEETSTPVQAV